jgi:hypothetical protein
VSGPQTRIRGERIERLLGLVEIDIGYIAK